MTKALVSLLIIAIGATITVKSEWFYEFFGPVEWAEKYLGTSGGSRLFYKLLGILVVLLTFMSWAGILQNILIWIFAPAGTVLKK